MANVAAPGSPLEGVGGAGNTRPTASIAARIGRTGADWLPALPLLLVAFALLVLPTAALVVDSFRDDAGRWTLAAWNETLNRRGDRRAIATSLRLGVVSATIAAAVGAPLAWLISRMATAGRSTWLALLNVAANFGGIGLAFGYVAALGTFGMVTLALRQIGLGFSPPASASFPGLVIAYAYTNVPLFVLLTLPAMGLVRREWMEAAEVAAATRFQFWRFVGVPVLTPFLAAGWLLIFTWSIGIYGLAYALAGTGATAQLRLMTLQIGVALNSSATGQDRAAVLAVLLLLFATASLITYRLTLRWALRWFA